MSEVHRFKCDSCGCEATEENVKAWFVLFRKKDPRGIDIYSWPTSGNCQTSGVEHYCSPQCLSSRVTAFAMRNDL